MIREASLAAHPFALVFVAWLSTYLAHSTVALGGAWLLDRRLRRAADRDALWKVALLAALVTSVAGSLLGYSPLGVQMRLDRAAQTAELKGAAPLADADAAVASARDRDGRRAAQATAIAAPTREGAGAAGSTAASRSAGAAPSRTPAARGSRPLLASLATALPWLWAAVTAALVLRLLAGHRRLRRQLDDRRPLADAHLETALAALAAEAGLRRPPRLTVTARCSTPLAIGRAEVCVPDRFVDELAPAAQRAALAHEVAHLARRDPLWQLAAAALEAAFFLQPLHRLARRRLRETAELLCDDWAASRSGGLDLAQCLLAVSEWLRQGPLGAPREVLAMAEGGPGLARRIERLLAGGSAGAGRAGFRAAAAALALVATAAVAPAVVSTSPASDDTGAGGGAIGPSAVGGGHGGDGSVARSGRARGAAAGAVPVRRAPVADFEAAWRWSENDAASRGERAWWLAWSTAGRVGSEDQALDDSAGNAFQDLRGPAIVRRLGVEDEVTRATVDAIVVFVQRGRGAERPLRVAVRSPYLGMRLSGPVYWLGAAAPAPSLQRLAGLYVVSAGHPTGEALIETIALHEAPAAVDFLAEVLHEGPAGDRAQAAEGLAYWPGERATSLLHDAAANDPSGQVAAEAAETLGAMPPELALPRLRELVWGDVRTQVGLEAVEALGDMRAAAGTDLLDEVIAELPREELVREAVESLGALPRETSEPRLRRVATEHPMRGAREEAWETLGELVGEDVGQAHGEASGETLPELEYEHQADPEVEHETSTEQDFPYEWEGSASFREPRRMPALLLAAASGDSATVVRLVAAGADVDERAPRLGTPLIQAAAAGHLAVVERLLAAGADAALVEDSRDRHADLPRTALGAAARGGHHAVAERLLAAGAPVDLAPPGDPTPLMYAAEGGHVSTMELLMAHGADVNARIRGDGTPLIAATRGGHPKVVVRLLDAGADPNLGVTGDETPLHQAVEARNRRLVQLLLERGARPDLRAPGAESALALAAEQGDLALVSLMMPYARSRADDR